MTGSIKSYVIHILCTKSILPRCYYPLGGQPSSCRVNDTTGYSGILSTRYKTRWKGNVCICFLNKLPVWKTLFLLISTVKLLGMILHWNTDFEMWLVSAVGQIHSNVAGKLYTRSHSIYKILKAKLQFKTVWDPEVKAPIKTENKIELEKLWERR